jgi:hypothetical protein
VHANRQELPDERAEEFQNTKEILTAQGIDQLLRLVRQNGEKLRGKGEAPPAPNRDASDPSPVRRCENVPPPPTAMR